MITRVVPAAAILALGAGLLLAVPAAAASPTSGAFTLQTTYGPALPPRGEANPETPNSCPPDPTYSTYNAVGLFLGDAARKVTGRGPETLSVTVTSSDAVGTSVSTTVGASVSGIIASARVDISAGISQTVTAGTTYGATYQVPSGHLGWLEWGNWGYHYSWSYGHYSGCTWVTESGTARSPQLSGKGFDHGYS